MIEYRLTKRQVRGLMGSVLAIGLATQCYRSLSARTEDSFESRSPAVAARPAANQAIAATTIRDESLTALTLEETAARDPMAFLEGVLERYDRSVRDYTCLFTKRELVHGRMTERQVIEVQFRESPFSVLMKWVENADKCSRVLYVADRWVKDGQQYAVVEPGAIAKLFVPYVMRPIHGEDALKSSRRTIDQFGLRSSLALTLKYCRLAREKNILDLRFLGTGQVEGRETLVFERRLPYTGENGAWPDRVLVLHLDKELLVPTLCLAYADNGKTQLLGEYATTRIKLNTNLPDSVFSKEGMGLQ